MIHNLSYCLGGDNVAVLQGFNITNGMRIYHVYYSYDMTQAGVILFILGFAMLVYGLFKAAHSPMRNMRSGNKARDVLHCPPANDDKEKPHD